MKCIQIEFQNHETISIITPLHLCKLVIPMVIGIVADFFQNLFTTLATYPIT